MEDDTKNEEENATLNYRGKYCLIKYILHLLKDDVDKLIRQKSMKIDIISAGNKSLVGSINYTMTINSLFYNKKIDIIENIPKLQKINQSNYIIRDEFHNQVNYNEISIKVNLLPSLNIKTVIDFEFFNFFFYNGKIFHKFVIKPRDEDEFLDERCKLFIYFHSHHNKISCDGLIKDLINFTKDENVWKVISHIYLILPFKDKNSIKEKYKENLEYLKIKENNIPKTSIVYLTEDINDGNAINIFNNYYQKNYFNFFFILNNKNKVKLLSPQTSLTKEFQKFSDDFIKLKNPVGTYKTEKKLKEKNLINLFNFLSSFIDELPNLNYIFDFNFNMKYSIVLDEPMNYFKLYEIDKIEIWGSLRTNDYLKFKNFSDEIQSEKFIFKLKELETKNIPINFANPFKCKVCKKEIPNDKECFYCYRCIEYYCYECVKKHINSKDGINKFIDKKHNLIFFKTRDINNFMNIDSHKLGKDSFTKSTSFKTSHSASCDGCASGFYNSPRYVCLTCKPGMYLDGGYCDYCNNCIENMMTNGDKGKQIQQKVTVIQYKYGTFCKNHAIVERHDHENHIYLMVALEGIYSNYQGF